MLLKQFHSIGAPTCSDTMDKMNRVMSNIHPDASRAPCIVWFLSLADAGPDQSLVNKWQRAELAGHVTILSADIDCLIHQYHLQIKALFHAVDGLVCSCVSPASQHFKYFGSLATIMNTWRERGVDIFKEWARRSLEGAMAQAKRVAPRCLSGRWGSISECEKRLLLGDPGPSGTLAKARGT